MEPRAKASTVHESLHALRPSTLEGGGCCTGCTGCTGCTHWLHALVVPTLDSYLSLALCLGLGLGLNRYLYLSLSCRKRPPQPSTYQTRDQAKVMNWREPQCMHLSMITDWSDPSLLSCISNL